MQKKSILSGREPIVMLSFVFFIFFTLKNYFSIKRKAFQAFSEKSFTDKRCLFVALNIYLIKFTVAFKKNKFSIDIR